MARLNVALQQGFVARDGDQQKRTNPTVLNQNFDKIL
jgi:hypothetical protein